MTERSYLLRRCLRLEARIGDLQQKLPDVRPNRRYVTDADRAQIRALHDSGKTPRAIATETGWSMATVYTAISAPLTEMAVGE